MNKSLQEELKDNQDLVQKQQQSNVEQKTPQDQTLGTHKSEVKHNIEFSVGESFQDQLKKAREEQKTNDLFHQNDHSQQLGGSSELFLHEQNLKSLSEDKNFDSDYQKEFSQHLSQEQVQKQKKPLSCDICLNILGEVFEHEELNQKVQHMTKGCDRTRRILELGHQGSEEYKTIMSLFHQDVQRQAQEQLEAMEQDRLLRQNELEQKYHKKVWKSQKRLMFIGAIVAMLCVIIVNEGLRERIGKFVNRVESTFGLVPPLDPHRFSVDQLERVVSGLKHIDDHLGPKQTLEKLSELYSHLHLPVRNDTVFDDDKSKIRFVRDQTNNDLDKFIKELSKKNGNQHYIEQQRYHKENVDKLQKLKEKVNRYLTMAL